MGNKKNPLWGIMSNAFVLTPGIVQALFIDFEPSSSKFTLPQTKSPLVDDASNVIPIIFS
jgi:hypothetical protein